MTKRRAIRAALALLAAVLVAGLIFPVTVGSRTIQTCSLCRAERVDRTLVFFSWHTYRDTTFTDWHRAHRPAHEHQWGRLTCTRGHNIFGGWTYFACGNHHPVCEIPPDRLREFAERADANTLAEYFDGIASPDPALQRRAVQMACDDVRGGR